MDRQTLILTLCVLLWSAPMQAGVYKCLDDKGRAVFSGTPCGDDAKQITIDYQAAPEAPVTGPRPSVQEQMEAFTQRQEKKRQQNRISAVDRKINQLKLKRTRLRKERDAKLAKERDADLILTAENMQVSHAWQQRVVVEYEAKIAEVNEQIDELRLRRQELTRQ